MKSAVGLECQGIKMHRGPVLWKRAAQDYGIKGNKHKVYEVLCAMVATAQREQEHITEVDGRIIREVGGHEIT